MRTSFGAIETSKLSRVFTVGWSCYKDETFKLIILVPVRHTRFLIDQIYIEYFMESARVPCLHTSCGVSEIEQLSEANE